MFATSHESTNGTKNIAKVSEHQTIWYLSVWKEKVIYLKEKDKSVADLFSTQNNFTPLQIRGRTVRLLATGTSNQQLFHRDFSMVICEWIF